MKREKAIVAADEARTSSPPPLQFWDGYVLAFGLCLGLCILKFGDPVILDQKIDAPSSWSEYWSDSWPTHWANWIFFFLVAIGVAGFLFTAGRGSGTSRSRQQGGRPSLMGLSKSLIFLPLLWMGWQFVSATQTVDADLTATTLWQYGGCIAAYFVGALLLDTPKRLQFLIPGILAALAVCLICAVRQRIEFPQDTKLLVQSQQAGFTNLPSRTLLEMRRDQTIVTTNGMEIVNPAILARFAKGRVMGTMVYPNALAQIILLLFPVAFVLAVRGTRTLRPIVRAGAIVMSGGLAVAGFFWSGSKFGWLIAMAIGGLYLFRLRWPVRLKIAAFVVVAVLGAGLFSVRFHNYFAKGATSVVARFDYWRAAAQTTVARPLFGTGPGTFQRPYAQLKSPKAEMARLAHNDYLEQFSDSGVPGGIFYCAWLALALGFISRKAWKSPEPLEFALFLGLLAWAIQEFGEFGLFIPASAWTAFALMGAMVKTKGLKNARDAEG